MRAWLEIMRISNAPTVVSNAIAGAVLGAAAANPAAPVIAIDHRAVVVFAPLLCYLGGMVLNDAFDAAVDARERPSRPIPSGRIPRAQAFIAGVLLLLGGIGAALASGSAIAAGSVALLALLVVTYNAVHSYTAASVLLLALCRALAALIPMIVFATNLESIASSGILVHPVVLAAWTLLLSILARGEVAAPSMPYPSCPSCGHPMLTGAGACSECGKRPNPAVAETRASQRALLLDVSRLALIPAFAAAFVLLLPREPVTFEGFNRAKGPVIAMIAALGLSTLLVLEARRRAHGRIGTPRFVGFLIAALAGIDAVALVTIGQPLALACAGCFIATLALQRRIAGS